MMASDITSSSNKKFIHHKIYKQSFSVSNTRKDGLLVQVHHTVSEQRGKKKCIRFHNVTFSDNCEQISACDQAGNIFIIDLLNLKYWMLPTFGYCSSVAYSTYKKNEILVGKDNGAVEFVNTETGSINGVLIGHRLPVHWISFSSGQPYCLTATVNEALIWDLQTNKQIHQLTLHTTIKLKQVRFVPVSDNILACFEDDTIQVWDFETFQSVTQISPERWKNHQMNASCFSRNGNKLVISGNTVDIFVVSLLSWKIQKELHLPEQRNGVKQLEFLPQAFDGGENKVLTALTNDGVMYFFNIESCKILKSIKLPRNICVNKLLCSDNGKYTVFILDTGELNIYNTEQLFPGISSTLLSYDEHEQKQKPVKKYHSECTKEIYSNKPLKSQQASLTLQNHLNNQINCVLNTERLKPILKEFGEYPENYRTLIWKKVLQLPNNKSAYEALVSKGYHIVSESLDEKYPLCNKSLLSGLKRVVSCLSHWSPLFSQVQYLPLFIFPFVKVLKHDPVACFEAIATVILNWCQRWFEFFPFPPVNVLSLAENILCEWDEQLLIWFTEHQVTSHIYAWPMLETSFTEVLNGKEWLQLFDNILSNEPSFIIFAVVSYNIICRTSLLNLNDLNDFEFFFRNPTAVDMKKLISKIYHLHCYTTENHPRKHFKPFTPLATGDTYLMFNEYPKFIIDKQAEQINSMRMEELQLLKEQCRLTNARVEQEKERDKLIRKQIQSSELRELEAKYKEKLQEEEERVNKHRHKVMSMKRELRLREIKLLEDTREHVLQQNAEKRKADLETLLLDLDRKRVQQEMEVREAEEQTREQYEALQLQKKQLEFQLDVTDSVNNHPPLQHRILQEQHKKLSNNILKLREEASSLHIDRRNEICNKLATAENLLQSTEVQIAHEMAERQNTLFAGQQNIDVMNMESKTSHLENNVEKLLNKLVKQRLKESRDRKKFLTDSISDRHTLYNEQLDLVNQASVKNLFKQDIHSSSSHSSDFISQRGFVKQQTNGLSQDPAFLSSDVDSNDFLGRSATFYRREQEAIKSVMDLRQKLIENK